MGESKDKFQGRQMDLLRQLHYAPEETIAVVGHSHFIRELFRHHLAEDATLDGATREELQSDLVCNAGVVALRCDFARFPQVIVAATLVLGAYMKGKAAAEGSDDDDDD